MLQTNVYNGLDTRVGSTTNSVANTYLRNGAYVTDAVLKDSTATFTPGVSERRGATTTFSHAGLKNADAQTGVSQTVAATKQYDAFGNLAPLDAPTGSREGEIAGKQRSISPTTTQTWTTSEGLSNGVQLN